MPPKFVDTPRAKLVMLHGPHHAAQPTPFWLATTVDERPAPLLNTGVHCEPFWMAKPSVLIHTYWPPAIHVLPFTLSGSNGAMKRGNGSCGSMSRTDRVMPSERPQFSVTSIARKTYS